MSDQPFPLGYLEQFSRSFARPDLDRIIRYGWRNAVETRAIQPDL